MWYALAVLLGASLGLNAALLRHLVWPPSHPTAYAELRRPLPNDEDVQLRVIRITQLSNHRARTLRHKRREEKKRRDSGLDE